MIYRDRYVSVVLARPIVPKVRHYWGLPPTLTETVKPPEAMPSGSVLLIELKSDGIFLIRFSGDGEEVGDTWHQSIDEAKEQAAYEFGEGISEWVRVPSTEEDPFRFAIKNAGA